MPILGVEIEKERVDAALPYADEKTFFRHVLPGGLMIGGTSTPYGQIWAANAARKKESGTWDMEALVFSTNFRMGFDITDFQAVLPKNLIHHVVPGEPVHDFFQAWKHSAVETSAIKPYGLSQWFIHTAQSLAQKGYRVNLKRKFLAKGWLIWEL